ncbi:MAG: response regulator [Candidatus Omnitrophota bacterium]|jgi:two-component system alkaline phosphatase synthesis response regulator PhoP|nr:response regulator [Candidatus Omnitrophota bacterium]
MEKRRVLVVDDEENLRKLLKLNLEETGKFTVETLANVKDLIDTLHMFKPEVILLDLLMPGLGGLEACEMLNRDPFGQGVPIIILSSLAKDGDKRAAYGKGVVDYLVKPIEKDDLVAKIEKALLNKDSLS